MLNFTLFVLSWTASVLSMVLRGFVVCVFWKWFVLVLFPAAPVMTIPLAIGLVYLVYLVKPNPLSYTDWMAETKLETEARFSFSLIQSANSMLLTLILWLCGYLVHLLV